MKSIKVVHIGDIHYPDCYNKPPESDIKDDGFNEGFTDKLAPIPFLEVGRCLVQCLEKKDISGILFSGDLTTAGNAGLYEECVKYFTNLISHVEADTDKKFNIHVTPGNHDLNRKKITTNFELRFKDFSTAWENEGRAVLPVQNVESSILKKGDMALSIFSLNTCLGCGEEYKKIPDKIAAIYQELLNDSGNEDTNLYNDISERIDTPAISNDHIANIETSISASDDKSLNLILGHHALLPQPRLRVSLYTEILNAGNTRLTLSTLNKPVVYCHGHIHDDPIEVLSSPDNEDSNLILISAPLYTDGFNIIEVFYSDSGYPVGLTVHRHRTQNWGRVREISPIRIPLRRPRSMMKFCDQKVEDLYRFIPADGIRFRELEKSASSQDINFEDGEMEKMIDELEWLGVISVANKSKDKPCRGWIITRIGL